MADEFKAIRNCRSAGLRCSEKSAAGEITLVDHADRLKHLNATQAAAVVLCEKIAATSTAAASSSGCKPAIVVADVHAAFATIVSHFRPQRSERAVGISPRAIVSPSARWGKNVNIHPGATIGDDCQIGDGTTILPGAQMLAGCEIGRDVTIGPGAVLYENTIVGDRSIIHGSAVIGAYGFGYSHVAGRHVLSAQLGYVRIGSDVEIGAGTTIDRGTYGATSIGDGTKIDNLVQIAHNCRIGRHNLICAQVGIAGSTSTGDYVVMGGQAGVARSCAHRHRREAERDGRHHERRAGRRRHAGHPGHARARTEAEARGAGEAARNAAGIQSDAPSGCRAAKAGGHRPEIHIESEQAA